MQIGQCPLNVHWTVFFVASSFSTCMVVQDRIPDIVVPPRYLYHQDSGPNLRVQGCKSEPPIRFWTAQWDGLLHEASGSAGSSRCASLVD